jgi:hypothetical protein
MRTQFTTRVGDDTTDDGRKLLTERSPLTYASRIQRPLLIGRRERSARADGVVVLGVGMMRFGRERNREACNDGEDDASHGRAPVGAAGESGVV